MLIIIKRYWEYENSSEKVIVNKKEIEIGDNSRNKNENNVNNIKRDWKEWYSSRKDIDNSENSVRKETEVGDDSSRGGAEIGDNNNSKILLIIKYCW